MTDSESTILIQIEENNEPEMMWGVLDHTGQVNDDESWLIAVRINRRPTPLWVFKSVSLNISYSAILMRTFQ